MIDLDEFLRLLVKGGTWVYEVWVWAERLGEERWIGEVERGRRG